MEERGGGHSNECMWAFTVRALYVPKVNDDEQGKSGRLALMSHESNDCSHSATPYNTPQPKTLHLRQEN